MWRGGVLIRSYKQLSQKYLRSNIKRTLLTLTGIILALALITTIGLFFNSGYTSGIDNAKKVLWVPQIF